MYYYTMYLVAVFWLTLERVLALSRAVVGAKASEIPGGAYHNHSETAKFNRTIDSKGSFHAVVGVDYFSATLELLS